MRGTDGLYTERFSNEPITGAIYGDYGKEGKVNNVKKKHENNQINKKHPNRN